MSTISNHGRAVVLQLLTIWHSHAFPALCIKPPGIAPAIPGPGNLFACSTLGSIAGRTILHSPSFGESTAEPQLAEQRSLHSK